jgi:hypothetical protein
MGDEIMSAIDTLRAAAAAGVRVTVERGRLLLKASTEPPATLIDALRRHKADIIALLEPAAGVGHAPCNAERDGGIPRVWAEAQARLSRQRSPPDGVRYTQWDQLRDDFGRFYERWASDAASMGWRPTDLLGWNPQYPYTPSAMHRGLAWRFEGAPVVEVTRDAVVIARHGVRTTLPRHWQI